MKKLKKTELQLEKVVVIALNDTDLSEVRGGQDTEPRSDMWVTKDYECRTKYDGCKSQTACVVESVDVCIQTRQNPGCLPIDPLTLNGCLLPVTVK